MAVFRVDSAATGANNGTSWTNAYTSAAALFAAAPAFAAGDDIEIASTSSDTSVGATWSVGTGATPVRILSVNKTTGDLEEGATVNIITADSLLNGNLYVFGVTFSSTARTITFNGASNVAHQVYDTCRFHNTTSGVRFGANATTPRQFTRLRNCIFKSTNAAMTISVWSRNCFFENCSIDPTSATLTTAITLNYAHSDLTAIGCDFSKATNLISVAATAGATAKFIGCKTPANTFTGTHGGLGASQIELQGCDSPGLTQDHNYQYYRYDPAGILIHDTGVYKNGGFTNIDNAGTAVPLALKMVTNTLVSQTVPLYTPWFYQAVLATGSKTIAVHVGHALATLPKDTELFLEIQYSNDTTNNLLTDAHTRPVVAGTDAFDIRAGGTPLTDLGAAGWTKPASEVTKSHTLSKTITIANQGSLQVRVGCCIASATVYIDPQVTVA